MSLRREPDSVKEVVAVEIRGEQTGREEEEGEEEEKERKRQMSADQVRTCLNVCGDICWGAFLFRSIMAAQMSSSSSSPSFLVIFSLS